MDKVYLGGFGIMQLMQSVQHLSEPVRYYGTVEDKGTPYKVYGTKYTDKVKFYAVKV
jgi:hypothetical protein